MDGDLFFFIFIIFTIFVCCSLCGFCCKRREEGAIFSTPVVITSTTHQPPGANYEIQTSQTTITGNQMPYPPQQGISMPTNFSTNQGAPYTPMQPVAPYPPMNAAAPYPPTAAPYPPTTAPYPPAATPYPPAAAPYPPQAMQNPPSYNEAVNTLPTQDFYQKQAPYNPSFGGN